MIPEPPTVKMCPSKNHELLNEVRLRLAYYDAQLGLPDSRWGYIEARSRRAIAFATLML
jgi:hypothetical protein